MWLSPCGFALSASKVENAIAPQKCQEGEGEKKTMMKKMMVWEPRAGLWHWVGRRWESQSTP